MQSILSNTFYTGNRQKLRAACPQNAPIVLAANGLLQRGGDNPFPFHQDSNFWYCTGINEPDLVLVIDANNEYLMVPGRSTSREAFDGAIDVAALQNRSGIKEIVTFEEGWQRLNARLGQAGKVLTTEAAPAYIEHYGMFTNPAGARLIERLKSAGDGVEVVDIRQQITHMRVIKQPEELEALQTAINTTIQGIQNVGDPNRLPEYTYEYEIESDLTRAFRTVYASGHAFAPIVAAGKRGCTLHNVDNSGRLQTGELVVIDVGAEVSHYAADITRTLAIGAPSERQQAVYDAVLDVQAFALTKLRPGVLLKEYETEVEQYLGGKLQELGLITSLDHDAIRTYYPHAASHFLGLDVHDVGDYREPLATGMVITCEPGIYIPEEGIGVRIEDDVLITDDGNTVLSAALPKTLILN